MARVIVMYVCISKQAKERETDRQTVIVFGSVCNNRRNSGNSRQNDINRCKILDFDVFEAMFTTSSKMIETATVLIVTTTAH